MQDRIKMNGTEIYQPDSGNLEYNFETTYTEGSGRVISGVDMATPLFTVEQLGYTASNIPIAESSKILKIIAKGGKFTLHYFSPYYGEWRDGSFRVGKGSTKIGKLIEGGEKISTLSFNMTGCNPI